MKCGIILVLVACAVAVQGFPYRINDIPSEAILGHWDNVHRLLTEWHRRQHNLIPISQPSVANLAPQSPGDKVFGEAQSSFVSSSTNNGETAVTGNQHTLINDNGKIYEFDRPLGSF